MARKVNEIQTMIQPRTGFAAATSTATHGTGQRNPRRERAQHANGHREVCPTTAIGTSKSPPGTRNFRNETVVTMPVAMDTKRERPRDRRTGLLALHGMGVLSKTASRRRHPRRGSGMGLGHVALQLYIEHGV